MTSIDFEKVIFLVRKLYATEESRKWMLPVVEFCNFKFENHWNQEQFPTAYNLILFLDHEVFLRFYSSTEVIAQAIKKDINKSSDLIIDKINITPDYDKFEIIGSKIEPVYTEWEEINNSQIKLLEQLNRSSGSLDFRNIGNSSRAMLEKLANLVFVYERHKPSDPNIDVGQDKYKNRLHSYIRVELCGNENDALRQYAESAISSVEKAVDLANALTHKTEANRTFAEACIIGTISAISLIKLTRKK